MMSDHEDEVATKDPSKSVQDSSHDEDEASTSGYGTESAGVGRSDTLDSVSKSTGKKDIFQDDSDEDDDDMFKSARIDPEPDYHGSRNGLNGSQPFPEPDKEISLDDDDVEEEATFKDAHMQPEFQLSGGSASAASAVLGGTMVCRDDIFGGEFSPQTETALSKGYSSIKESSEKRISDGPEEFIEIKVVEPRKQGEGMSSFLVYKVITRTNVSYFKKSEFAVIRRFSDFLGLHQKLSEKYLQNGRIIPPAPDKSVVGTTKIKMAKEAENQVQDEFVERRRAALERFINRTAQHPSFKADPDFREFLELDTDLPKSSQTAALSGKNVMRLLSKVGDSLSSITLKMEERDDWFETKSRWIEQLDEQLKKLHFSTEALAEYRRNLALSAGNVGKSLSILSGCEDDVNLSGAIAHLAEVQKSMEQIHNDQACADFFYLSELIKDYIGLVGAMREAFQERIKAWQSWQNETTSLTKKREAKVKAELQAKPDRIHQITQEITELERKQDMAQENFDRISRLIKKEVELFDVRKAEDFKKSIIQYLEAMHKAQENISLQWEKYLPEIQRVNT